MNEAAQIVAFIRGRSASVDNLTNHGRLTSEEGSRLSRWLNALADDVEAGLHNNTEGEVTDDKIL